MREARIVVTKLLWNKNKRKEKEEELNWDLKLNNEKFRMLRH